MAAQEKYHAMKANQANDGGDGAQQFRKQSKTQVDNLDDDNEFDDFETVAEKKKVIRPPIQKPQAPNVLPPGKMHRKMSDND